MNSHPKDLTPSRRLRAALSRAATDGPLMAPGAYDGLSALLIEQAGFDAVYMTGFGTAASLLGMPDVGLLSATEMVDQARRIVGATTLPVIADADTGYGNVLNVTRTVRGYEAAGVAAIQLEDQVAPKKCGHMAGKAVVPMNEMVGKIAAAADARRDDDTVIIARTDAIATDGIDIALERAHAYREAGADVLFVEAPTTEADVERVAAELRGMPLVYNWAEGGRSPQLSAKRLHELGFAMTIFPIGTLLAATRGVQRQLAEVRRSGVPTASLTDLPTFDEFTALVGLEDVQALANKYELLQEAR